MCGIRCLRRAIQVSAAGQTAPGMFVDDVFALIEEMYPGATYYVGIDDNNYQLCFKINRITIADNRFQIDIDVCVKGGEQTADEIIISTEIMLFYDHIYGFPLRRDHPGLVH